ncbi:hypothetical protein DFH11DRAFT_691703 [Phellopilus nigrolimitatus]|nr:hypothetical protein DFH11DRAFT_691703 [Phellopilus nigrolimitatus]
MPVVNTTLHCANDLRVITQEPNKFISKAEYLKAFEENGSSRFFQDRNCFSKTKTDTRSPENCMGSGEKTRSRSSVRRSYTPVMLQHSTASRMPRHARIQPSLHNTHSPHVPQGAVPSHCCCPDQLHINRSDCSEDIFSNPDDTSPRSANVFSQPPHEDIRRDSSSGESIRDVELAPRISKGSLSFVLNPDSSHIDRQAEHQRTSGPPTHRESLGFPGEIRERRIANLETRPSRLQGLRLSIGLGENMQRDFSAHARAAYNQQTSHLYSPPKSISLSSAGHRFQSPSNSQIPTVSCRNTWPSVAMKMENASSFPGLPISRHMFRSSQVDKA